MLRPATLLLLLAAPIALVPAGCGGSGSSTTRGSAAADRRGRVWDALRLLPEAGARVDAGGFATTTGADGRFRVPTPPDGRITVGADGFYPARLQLDAGLGRRQPLELALVPVPPSGFPFDADSAVITNRYLAGLTDEDEAEYRLGGDDHGPEFEFEVRGRVTVNGVEGLLLRWEDGPLHGFESVVAEDVYGNVRLLATGGVPLPGPVPPLLLPEVPTTGLVLVDLWGGEMVVVDPEGRAQPHPRTGLTAPYSPCLITSGLDRERTDVWAPGAGLVATDFFGPPGTLWQLVEGKLGGQPIGGGAPAAYGPASATVTRSALAGLRPGDFGRLAGYGSQAGHERRWQVTGLETVAGIETLVWEMRLDGDLVERLWLAEDLAGNLRLLREEADGLRSEHDPARAPRLLPAVWREGEHLGVRAGDRSQEVEHVDRILDTHGPFGRVEGAAEIETEGDHGFRKEEAFWVAGLGLVRLEVEERDGFDLVELRLGG